MKPLILILAVLLSGCVSAESRCASKGGVYLAPHCFPGDMLK